MTKDRKILYTLATLPTVLLFVSFLVPPTARLITTVLVLILTAVAVCLGVKKRSIYSFNKGQVLFLLAVIGILYLTLLYASGIYFGFRKTTVQFSFYSFVKITIPLAVGIVTVEIIRSVLLAQEEKAVNILAYVFCSAAETILFWDSVRILSFNDFMDLVGQIIIPALSANFLYNYLSRRYGKYPNIVYRLVIALYPHVMPYEPSVPDSIMAFVKLLVPIFIFVFIDSLFEKKKRYATKRRGPLSYISVALVTLFIVSIAMLISCQFRFGLIVVGSESMTGEINKGDAIVYEQYDGQIIEEGQVIVFEKGNSLVIHRVVEIKRVNGHNRYFTKGDANEEEDTGYITDGQIRGVTNFKIAYIGYPTLWLRDIFAGNLWG